MVDNLTHDIIKDTNIKDFGDDIIPDFTNYQNCICLCFVTINTKNNYFE